MLTGIDVLVIDNMISKISTNSLNEIDDNNTKIIDSSGMTLMPGMIDAHTHFAISDKPSIMENSMTWEDLAVRSTVNAKNWLMNGITTVRDICGPVFGLQHAIDAGYVEGPRIYPSGACISQTAGHADFRDLGDRNPFLTGSEDSQLNRLGYYTLADGSDLVLAAVRQNLMQGAAQIKILASGGLGSLYDPSESEQYTPNEMKAAVAAASDYGTYMTAHVHTNEAIERAIDSGVMSLEHAQMINETNMQKVVEKGVFLVPQMSIFSPEVFDIPFFPEEKIESMKRVQNDSKDFVTLIQKYKPNIVYSVDAVGTPEEGEKILRHELFMSSSLFGNYETLRQATSGASELLAMSGLKNPYPDAKLGIIEECSHVDILLIDGNPLEDITLLGASEQLFYEGKAKPIETIKLIMKDGKIYKNTIDG